MELTVMLALLGALTAAPQMAVALGADDADTMFAALNTALLSSNGDTVFYKKALNSNDPDTSWYGCSSYILRSLVS
jgi:hypothetical protein